MKLLSNLPGIFKALRALGTLTQYRKQIREARQTGNISEEQKYILKATSKWGNKMLELFDARLDITGKENLPLEGPVVYVANHQGYADIIAMCAALDTIQFGFVAKEELKKIPLYGNWIKEIHSVLIKRNNARESLKAISQGIKNIEEGFSMLIFPEGTRSRGKEMASFKKGSLKLATKPKVPIVPISIEGSYKCFEESGKLQGALIKVKIHPMVETAHLSKEEEKILPKEIETIIREGVRSLQQ